MYRSRQEGRAVVKNADMPEDMQQDAVEVATTAMNRNTVEKEIAAEIKKEFDRRFNPNWHCIVGRSFGWYAPLHFNIFSCPYFIPSGYHNGTSNFRRLK
ncbi:unnamed protein product [Dibothriocephalus latus]|uniref:Dynein light chain n=1 Tax=Dibothriocephalus latus TaxID=60516 RepID=A0A3P6PAX8_DIBLA|nr:unnamed protein product [Dibothriocephalus latus]